MFAIDRKAARFGFLALMVISPAAFWPPAARAQEMLQLIVPAKEYKLGRFKYQPPQADGWRQMSVSPDTLSLVYAEKKSEDDDSAINTNFGVAFEAHDIPENVQVPNGQFLADMSLKQISEARKADLVSAEPVQPVPSVPDLFTYRLLVHSPIKGDPDGYEVYYVLTSPDRKQYLVLQCITKSQKYQDELYFMQFYGSLASLKYEGPSAGAASPAPAAPPAAAATAPATGTTAPGAAAPATPPAH